MTISTAAVPLSYAGNDSTTDFAVTWIYIAKSHVVVTLRDAAGVETLQILDTDYTLTDPGDTGTVGMTNAPATGETLVITSEPPNTQETDIPLGGSFPARSVEDALDLASQVSQKVDQKIDRSLVVPKTDTRSGSQLEIPNETARALKFLTFDASGDPIVTAVAPIGGAVVTPFAETYLDDTTQTATLATLGAAGLTLANPLSGVNTFSAAPILSGVAIEHDVHTEAVNATTSDIWTGGNTCLFSGVATVITDVVDAPRVGTVRYTVMNAGHTITNNANIAMDGGRDYICVSGDILRWEAITVSTFRVSIHSYGARTPVGGVVQIAYTQTGALTASVPMTIIPIDDTIPQNTEGDEYMTLVITPTSSSNKLLIDMIGLFSHSVATENIIMCLFQDAIANALATMETFQGTANAPQEIFLRHEMTAPSTSAITFKMRAGSANAGNMRFNGISTGRLFGGTFASSIRITEIQV